ncbi:hypothetical protein KDA_68890 [Dictyobacter alpinus]|uniref:Uncharacterized protein n=2 Tax=Dictyobacter alpinus TaxID=2014873 RepID=A0A402BJ65_9CHLR|nr:hypothetical protein KDA_68890 [Dictyobacter alpinus]
MRDPQQIDSKEMAKWLDIRKNNGNPTTLLLGSRAGALFRSDHFYTSMQSMDHPIFNQLSMLKKFSQCYNLLKKLPFSETDIYSIFQTSLKDMSVTQADACLASLIMRGYFAEIITTNIDDILEQALTQVDIKETRDFEVLIPGRGKLVPEQKNFQYRITKAYGDFSAREYYVITGHSALNQEKFEELKRFLQNILAKDILIIGIDPYWDEYILRMFPQANDATIWFVNEEDLIEDRQVAPIFEKRKAGYITGHTGAYDRFMTILHNDLCGTFVPMHAEFAKDIISRLEDLSSSQQNILEEIKKLQEELDKLSPRRRKR